MLPRIPLIRTLKKWLKELTLFRFALILGALLVSDYYNGLIRTFILQRPYSEFQYPTETDYKKLVQLVLAANGSYDTLPTHLRPITAYNFPLIQTSSTCYEVNNNLFLLMVVKSAVVNFKNREFVRKSWGQLKEVMPGERNAAQVRTVFLLGMTNDEEVKQKVLQESHDHQDIVLYDFVDQYWNNTFKAIMGLRWTAQHCSNARFILFVDDDYFINPFAIVEHLHVYNFHITLKFIRFNSPYVVHF